MKHLPKLMILGYARHGKDTVCEILRDRFGYTFVSSSEFVGKRVVYPAAQAQDALARKHGVPTYSSFEACYADRINHRAFWFDSIAAFNSQDEARLGRELFSQHTIYCGLRRREEFLALKREGLFDHTLWVSALARLPVEDLSSCTVEPALADYIVDNNHTLQDLHTTVDVVMAKLGVTPLETSSCGKMTA